MEIKSLDKTSYSIRQEKVTDFNHGKTICDTFQKRNVFFSVKNEM